MLREAKHPARTLPFCLKSLLPTSSLRSSSQVGFFEFVCLPLFTHFTERFKASKPLLTGLRTNYDHWRGSA